jgi:hypothetical protein
MPDQKYGDENQQEQGEKNASPAGRRFVFEKVIKISAWRFIAQTQKRRTAHRPWGPLVWRFLDGRQNGV